MVSQGSEGDSQSHPSSRVSPQPSRSRACWGGHSISQTLLPSLCIRQESRTQQGPSQGGWSCGGSRRPGPGGQAHLSARKFCRRSRSRARAWAQPSVSWLLNKLESSKERHGDRTRRTATAPQTQGSPFPQDGGHLHPSATQTPAQPVPAHSRSRNLAQPEAQPDSRQLLQLLTAQGVLGERADAAVREVIISQAAKHQANQLENGAQERGEMNKTQKGRSLIPQTPASVLRKCS